MSSAQHLFKVSIGISMILGTGILRAEAPGLSPTDTTGGSEVLAQRRELPRPKGLTEEEAIAEAIAQSPGFRVIEAEAEMARGELETLRVRPAPELSFGPGWKRVREAEGGHNEFKGVLAVSQTLVFAGKRQLLAAIAEKNIEVKRAAAAGLRFQLTAQVRRSFAALRVAEGILALRQEQLRSAEVFEQAQQRRVEEGYASDFETVKAKGEVLAARRLLRTAEAKILEARIGLNTLLGREPGASLNLEGELSPSMGEWSEATLLQVARREHPGLRLQALQAELAGLNLRRARSSQQPQVAVGPTLEWSRSEQVIGVAATVAWPRKGANAGEIRSATAERRRVDAETEVLRREIEVEVLQAAARLRAAQEQWKLHTTSYVEELERVLRATERSHAENLTGLLVYLESKRSYFEALAARQEAAGEVAMARADLEGALGVSLASLPSETKS